MSLLRAAVIIPPIEDFYCTPHRMSSLGAVIVQQILEESSVEVKLIDAFRLPIKEKQIPLPSCLSYLQEHIIPGETGRSSFFTRFRRFGVSYEEIIDEISDFNPSMCLICCFAFCYSKTVIEISRRIKEKFF